MTSRARAFLRDHWADLLSALIVVAYQGIVLIAGGLLLLGAVPTVVGENAQGAFVPWLVVDDGRLAWSMTSLGSERTLLLVGMAGGALGAVLHGLQFTVHVAKGRHDWRWTLWHVVQPLKGGALGFAVYVASRAGFAVMDGSIEPPQAPYAILLACVVGGLFADETLRWLHERVPILSRQKQAKPPEPAPEQG